MPGMWMPWSIGPTTTLVFAAIFALGLAAMLDRAAYRLPRMLNAEIAQPRSRAHQRYRACFWAAGPVLAVLCAWFFGPTPAAAAAIVYTVTLLALAWIDAETGLLPDMLSLTLLWLGLLVNLNGGFIPLSDAVLGAAAGYMVPWCVCQLFYLITGRIGMGHGDFKLLAAIGAWLGWMSLPWVLLVSSSLALAFALALRLARRMKEGDPIRFGPYLAAAGILGLLRL